jgi:ammonium transporter, Amt family
MINGADTAWLLISGALVLFMTPGLALFYGGMVRAKSALNMMMMSFSAIGVTTIIWVLYGYSLAFGKDHNGFIGSFSHLGLGNTLSGTFGTDGHQVPTLAFAMFQLTFAIITVALLSGAIADRVKFSSWIVFVAAWISIVYVPVSHWVFAPGGWISNQLHALDFAGGTVVEINSGASALALVLVIGKRTGFKRDPMRPHNLPLVLLGAGILWFGWFGFNGGSALTSGALASTAVINTQIAAAAAAISWVLAERIRDGKATTLGVASGAVAGMVAITPACGFVNPFASLIIGLVSGALSSWAVALKYKFNYDDSLDVVGVHGVSGLFGMLAIGLFATTTVNAAGANHSLALLEKQAIASIAVAAFSFFATLALAKFIQSSIGFRSKLEDESTGLDQTYHAETAYDFSSISIR